jgi:peptidoglycan/xylan/chitin deacetylase (PgdA/CDA1 family)
MNRRDFLTVSAGAAAGLLLGKEVKAASNKSTPSSSSGLVALTFDDGYISIYDAAIRIMGKGIPGTNCLVPSWIGIGDSQQQAWDQVWELYNEYKWEIANHTISHADLTTLPDKDVVKAVMDAENAFMRNGIVTNRALIPPYGAFDDRVVKALEESGVVSSLRRAWAYQDGLNYPATFDPWAIEGYYVSKRTTFADLKKQIDKAVAYNGLLVLVIHRVTSSPSIDYDMSAKVLQDVCNYIRSLAKGNKASAVTLSQGVARMMQAQSSQ